MSRAMIRLPFPLPRAKQARECASPSYWREAEKRSRKLLKDPKVRAVLRRLGVLGTGGGGE